MKVPGGRMLLLIFSASVLVNCISALTEDVANNGKTEYVFTWFIENYSYSWHEIGKGLHSPKFTADGLEDSVWYLSLYPRGDREEYKGHISVFLMRNAVDDGPTDITLKYELSILAADRSTARNWTEIKWTFEKGDGYGRGKLLQIDDAISKFDFLPQDTLSVRCKIWVGEGSIQQVKQIVARTRIGVEHISFLHVVDDFSALLPSQNKIVEIGSPSKKEPALTSSLHFSDDSVCGGKIIMKITTAGDNRILSRCKLSLVNVSGQLIQAGEFDNRFGDIRKDITKLPLSLSRQVILDRKSEFLADDKLSLLWQGIFSTGIEYERIESVLHEIPFVVSRHVDDDDQKKNNKYKTEEKIFACSSALDDFKTIYDNQFLSDVKLETKTKSFYAHKIVLCARSAVFNATLINNTTNGVIHVDDLEDDTVQQLLIFLYSDKLENLDWESAMKLYGAANKYKIERLKVMSSSYLIDNLNTTTASEVLLLADNHNDSDLKLAVEDFIFKNEEQVFLSEEWRKLIETNPVLVSKTMLLKYMKKF